MINIIEGGAFLSKGRWLTPAEGHVLHLQHPDRARQESIAYRVLKKHNAAGPGEDLRITFDALASHDITYVGIVQTARGSGMQAFPVPYVLTNCHNSLCAVGGTINEDDHLFGLSAAQKYGGEYVPAHMAVIHQYMREMFAGCGKMILGSDSHTRYGALGTLGIGEGGPELVKQLLGRTYDLPAPAVVAVWLEGSPKAGVGPQDVALALIKAVFQKGVVKNKILEFIGPGVNSLSVDYRMGIDVMTTETTCLSSIWQTDEKVEGWLTAHGRGGDYQKLIPGEEVWYDTVIHLDLSRVEPMIALPFHPSNAWTICEFLTNAPDILLEVENEAAAILGGGLQPRLSSKFSRVNGKGRFMVDQGVVAGCSGGTFENIYRVGEIIKGHSMGNAAFNLAVYPASQPQYLEMMRTGLAATLLETGAILKTAFCGPCFGAGDVPAHNAFSIRHTTRNFPNREGSKPSGGQISYVALMDARSIAATAIHGGVLTAATDLPAPPEETACPYTFDVNVYEKRVYRGFGKPIAETALALGPNIADWPTMIGMPENLLLTVACAIYDPITTTDELIPSGETSSYRSNPLKLAEFTLSRKDPAYVGRAKAIARLEAARRMAFPSPGGAVAGTAMADTASLADVSKLFAGLEKAGMEAHTGIGSVVFARKPGDGSAREQAASCQKVLGGWANIAEEYATKRYRGNLVNWGMLPFVLKEAASFDLQVGDHIFLPEIRKVLLSGLEEAPATLYQNGVKRAIVLYLPALTKEERAIILAGCLMNHYKTLSV